METFREKLEEIKRIIEEDVYRKRVLLLCQQTEPRSFEEYSSSGSFRRLEKFESSTYSEVLRAVDMADNNKPVVMKIMRALSRGVIKRMPSITTKGCQSYNDILNELVVTQALSQLHDGVILNGQPNSLYRTHFFCQIHEIKVVSGNLDRTLRTSRKRATPGFTERRPVVGASKPPGTTEATAITSENKLTSVPASKSKPQDTESDTDISKSKSDLISTSKTNLSTVSSARDTSNEAAITRLDKKQNLSGAMVETTTSDVVKADDVQPARAIILEKPDERKEANGPTAARQEADANNNHNNNNGVNDDDAQLTKEEDVSNLPEDERMLMEALPHEYVVSVMRHDGQPLWWMMTHKKLSPEQLVSVLIQVIVGLAIAETVYLYEHRDLHVSNILIKRTPNDSIPFILDGTRYCVLSQGVKATIIDATFSRLTHNGRVYHRDLTSTLRAYGSKKTPVKMSLQNRSYRQMVRVTKNKWDEFTPKTNLIWLTYLCETLMKNEIIRADKKLLDEVRKIRDHTLKVKTTFDLLSCFPFERTSKTQNSASVQKSVTNAKA